jgi:hypothetical protein
VFDLADGLAERVVIGEWVSAIRGKLVDIMAGGEDLDAGFCAQDHDPDGGRRGLNGLKGGGNAVKENLAEGVDLAVSEGDDTDDVIDD